MGDCERHHVLGILVRESPDRRCAGDHPMIFGDSPLVQMALYFIGGLVEILKMIWKLLTMGLNR